MPLPPGPGPHRLARAVGPWQVHVHAHQGKVRRRIEDAWTLVEGVRMAGGGETLDAFAVFDGLGGVPNGQEAAWAAADGLRDALEGASDPQAILGRVNDRVRPTGGSTTAVILLVERRRGTHGHRAWLLTIGDSSAWLATDGAGLRRRNPLDRVDRHVLSDWLGRKAIGGHLIELTLANGSPVVLCTDGADEVAGPEAMRTLGAASPTATPRILDDLFERIHREGAPDNATVLVLQGRT